MSKTVTIEFQTEEQAEFFMAWFCDGGGESTYYDACAGAGEEAPYFDYHADGKFGGETGTQIKTK